MKKDKITDFGHELYKHFGQVKDFTLGLQIAKHFYELGRQSKRNIEICPHSIKSKSYAMNKPKPSEGLEDEAVSYCFDNGLNLSPMVATDFARHFAQWGAEHRGSSEIPKDLEEAAKEYCPDYAYPFSPAILKTIIREAFIAGAKWQEEQDLKYISEIHQNGYNLCKEQLTKELRSYCLDEMERFQGTDEGSRAAREVYYDIIGYLDNYERR